MTKEQVEMLDDWTFYVLKDYGFAEFPTGALVLDVGCGKGVQMQEIERRGCQAVGIERNWELIANCRVLGLKVLHAVGEEIPLKSRSCDGLICKVVMPYTNEISVFQEIGRVLKADAVGHLCYHGAGYYLRYLLV